jgi:hypothetical protein
MSGVTARLEAGASRWKVETEKAGCRRKLYSFNGMSTEGSVLLKSMLKASLVASAVFAIAWFRVPPTTMVLRYFIFYGILIAILSMLVGLPIAALIERTRVGRWWSYLTFAAATGALLGALSSHPTLESCGRPVAGSGEQETCIENPFAITFSPLTRSQPGFAENPSIQWSDYIGTIAFGAVVGGVLGMSFWVFYRWRARSAIDANDS